MVAVTEYRTITNINERKFGNGVLQWLLDFRTGEIIFNNVMDRYTVIGMFEEQPSCNFVYYCLNS